MIGLDPELREEDKDDEDRLHRCLFVTYISLMLVVISQVVVLGDY